MSSSIHEALQAFVDGELSEAEQAAFVAHLPECETCQTALEALERPAGEVSAARLSPAARLIVGFGLAALLAGGVVLVAVTSVQPAFDWSPSPSRALEGRLVFGPPSRHRPYDPASADRVPEAMIERLDDAHRKHALGVALLVRGDRARAIEVLESSRPNPALSNDLAVALLADGQPERALVAIDRALAEAPDDATARFNRALIAEHLGMVRVAIAEFGRASQTSDPDWSAEASARAAALAERAQHEPHPAPLAGARRGLGVPLEAPELEARFEAARARHDRSFVGLYGEELIDLDPLRAQTLHLHEALAAVDLFRIERPAARRELAEAARSGVPLSLDGVRVLAELVRWDGRAKELAMLEQTVAANRAALGADPGAALVVRQLMAMAHLRDARATSLTELDAIIREAERLPSDPGARRAATDARSVLALEDGEDGRFDDALRRIAEGQAREAPARCMLAVEAHLDRRVSVARDETGRAVGRLERGSFPPRVPAEVSAALARCDRVSILAGAAVLGTSGLLPREIAQAFVVDAPPIAGSPAADIEIVAGDRATPASVMGALSRAGWVELDLPVDGAGITTAPGRDDAARITVEALAAARWTGAPVVVLPSARDGAAGVAVAMLRAGALAVLISTSPLSEARAGQLFDDVRRRIVAGADPAVALRDARIAWSPGSPDAWVDGVVALVGSGG